VVDFLPKPFAREQLHQALVRATTSSAGPESPASSIARVSLRRSDGARV
jgi:FixJ family two-component response regulator